MPKGKLNFEENDALLIGYSAQRFMFFEGRIIDIGITIPQIHWYRCWNDMEKNFFANHEKKNCR